MWQIINLNALFETALIDNQTIRYNFSAWIGGWENNDDNVRVSVIFTDQTNTIIDSRITIGPVMAVDRNSVTSLQYRETIGIVPSGTRSITVFALFTRVSGNWNDGAIDNVAFIPYR